MRLAAESLDGPTRRCMTRSIDGWQIIQFPHLQSPFSDTDLDMIGYEFILQKMEVVS